VPFTGKRLIAHQKYWADVRAGIRKPSWEVRAERKKVAQESVSKESGQLAKIQARIAALTQESGELEKHRLFNLQSIALSGKAMVSVKDILEAAEPYEDLSGVYFLVRGAIVVYVGQSVSIHVRIRTHISDGRIFDRVAYIKCPPEKLDLLESLYIHHINPEENGNSQHGGKHAPLSFIQIGKALLSMDNSNSVRRISNEKGRVKCAD
jgi:hypothetical protein